jgi:hypothetical protein
MGYTYPQQQAVSNTGVMTSPTSPYGAYYGSGGTMPISPVPSYGYYNPYWHGMPAYVQDPVAHSMGYYTYTSPVHLAPTAQDEMQSTPTRASHSVSQQHDDPESQE